MSHVMRQAYDMLPCPKNQICLECNPNQKLTFATNRELAKYILTKQRTNVEVVGNYGPLTVKDLVKIIKKIEGTHEEILNAILPSRAKAGQQQRCLKWNGLHRGSGSYPSIWYCLPNTAKKNRKRVILHRLFYHNFVKAVPPYIPTSKKEQVCRHIHIDCQMKFILKMENAFWGVTFLLGENAGIEPP